MSARNCSNRILADMSVRNRIIHINKVFLAVASEGKEGIMSQPDLPKATILIVDDVDDIRIGLRLLLKKHGYQSSRSSRWSRSGKDRQGRTTRLNLDGFIYAKA